MTDATNAPYTDPSSDAANSDFQKYLAQWEAMQAQEQEERAQLASALALMMAMLHSGNAFGAMRVAELDVMPSVMGVQGDMVGVAGSTENLSSGLREFISELQNDFNSGSAIDSNNFANWFQDLYKTLTDPSTDSAISPDTKANLLNSLQAIAKAFAPDWTPSMSSSDFAKEIATNMSKWFPSTPPAAGSSPTVPPQIGAITAAFQELTAGNSSFSATQTSREQFLNTLFNQIQGVLSNMYQSDSALMSVAINNEKSA